MDIIKGFDSSQVFQGDVGLTCSADLAELYENYLSTNMPHLPKKFINEINGFVKRNAIEIKSPNLKSVQCICLMCLKAYIIDSSKSSGISDKMIDPMLSKFKCAIGHSGFYFNEGDVKILCVN